MSTEAIRWLGAEQPFLDTPTTHLCGPLVLGCYGGTTSAGAMKNEDAALVWVDPDRNWEWAFLCDAHYSAQSAALMLECLTSEEARIRSTLSQPTNTALPELEALLLEILRSPLMRVRSAEVVGEASCLFVVRHHHYVWWFSIGDCVAYLLHPVLTHYGQYGLNQRVFYQWIGHTNTFDRAVPCYSSGTQLIQPGRNIILLTTDGLLEFGSQPFTNPHFLYAVYSARDTLQQRVAMSLGMVQAELGVDSATVIAWEFDPAALYEQKQ